MSKSEAPSKPEALWGDVEWITDKTGLSHDSVSRLCRRKLIPGAFQLPGGKNAPWRFRKAERLIWINETAGSEQNKAKRQGGGNILYILIDRPQDTPVTFLFCLFDTRQARSR